MNVEKIVNKIMSNAQENIPANAEDYTGENGLLYCGRCRTPKQVEVTLFDEVRRPMCLCKCEIERLEREKEEQKRKELERRIKEYRRMGFPDSDMLEWTFANDDRANEKITNAMQRYVDNFAEFRKNGKGLLLYGDMGTGKTFAACEVANALIDKGHPVLVTNFARVLNTLQDTFHKQEYIDSLNDFQLLIIDDLGVERGTEFAREQVYNIIDSRYRARLPMIITTNLSIKELKSLDDISTGRIYDRILERCFPIEFKGESHRRKNIRNEYNDVREMLGL